MKRILTLALGIVMLLAACAPAVTATPTSVPPTAIPPTPVPPTPTTPAIPQLILATTTSTQDSGLLDVLIPLFEQQTGFTVQVVAVGSGQAMTMGQEGNADVLLVHSPSSEKTFMSDGYGSDRLLVMHNDFIIVGPEADPAGIKTATSAVDAFTKIANAKANFITRGDNSGTNTKELAIWKSVGITPEGDWYINTGQGMGASMTIASEKGAYILTDRATYLANKASYNLALLYEGDNSLLNVYHVIVVNPDKWPKVNNDGAKTFAAWITSPDTQKFIGEFGKDKYGQALFIPDADKTDADLGLK
jgi:tungstate transport system substrate-binding protein